VALRIASYRRHDVTRVRITVTNPGDVAAGTDAAHVFDPMFSSRSADDSDLHLGLGLYIVRMVAEAHRGQATFQAENGQVTVGLDLPAHADES